MAKALDYLASVGLVHRDVAARNVVVSDAATSSVGAAPSTKLCDFSLSRYPYSDDYVRTSDDAMPLPVRWLAPEALFAGRYSEASDAWSYAVMLWELYCGRALTRPFERHSDDQLIDAMAGRNGRRPVLPCVGGCPPATYALMTECWKDLPVRRPRFSTVLNRLQRPGDPDSRDASPAAASDSTGVTVVASMSSGSPHLGGGGGGGGGRTSSFRGGPGQACWKTGPGAVRRSPFSPPPAGGRCLLRQTAGSPLTLSRSHSVASADSSNVGGGGGVLM